MKDTDWSERLPRCTSTHRTKGDVHLYVCRVLGAVKHKSALPWRWSAEKWDQFNATMRVERNGRCATESEAQAAADAAQPSVLRAYDALAGAR